ncbi:MAG: bifunctional 5,10-methylene-tetrahydrofolate dehydrogenase/5,10-methylene-tetrahydrofolate cyclohydrolase [Euryarchaeota archaeon]|nr:bifunctional 5,10-methylene-tetrahydrofolate dehydrogenase/5,10-methylene-tetrahydrofolate cyclohydrolase [Euryarchaeota archaeon]
MSARIIDGRAIADAIETEVRADVARLAAKGVAPRLIVILIGDDPASQTYVKNKGKAATKTGISSETIALSEQTDESSLLKIIGDLNARRDAHGILVQTPLPSQIDGSRVIEAIDPAKDVDGFHPLNIGRMMSGADCLLPCTPWGVQELLVRSGHSPEGKHAVIVGRSSLVGRPLANLLTRKGRGGDATVTLCHSRTKDIAKHTLSADILISAIGRPKYITAGMVRSGAVVIDVGINSVPDSSAKNGRRLVGDVDFEAAKEKADAITPVPGGVGPMTVAMLMKNTVKAAKMQTGNQEELPDSTFS